MTRYGNTELSLKFQDQFFAYLKLHDLRDEPLYDIINNFGPKLVEVLKEENIKEITKYLGGSLNQDSVIDVLSSYVHDGECSKMVSVYTNIGFNNEIRFEVNLSESEANEYIEEYKTENQLIPGLEDVVKKCLKKDYN